MSARGIIPLLAFAGLLIFLAIGLTRDPRILPSELIDRPFPEFALENLEGDRVLGVEDLKGSVSLVNIFGSWCVSCEVEHPQLMAIRGTPGLRVIGVDWRDEKPAARRWLARNGNPYDMIIYDPDSALIVELGVAGAPETFVTDKNGRIRYKHVGIITADDWTKRLRPLVEQLNAE